MASFLAQRWLLDRRHFLRGAGAAVALPLLNCMTPLRAMTAEVGNKPRRSVFAYIPNGVNVLTWQITSAGKDYQLSEPLKSLEKHRPNITPISGLHHPQGIGQAHICADTWLTGARISMESAAYHNTISCDQVIAEVTAAKTRIASLVLSGAGGVGTPKTSHTLAYSRNGVSVPAEQNPSAVFQRLFGAEPDGIDVQRRRLDRRRSVLDTVLEQSNSLRKNLGAEDRSKLAEYLNSVREVEIRTKRLETWLSVPKPTIDEATAQHFKRNVTKAQLKDYYCTMYDLIVLALRTDMTRVVSYMSDNEGGSFTIPEIGVTQTRHELSHHGGNPELLEKLSKSDAFIVEQFSYFLDQLQSVQDGEDSLLDRTMVLFGSGMSHGHSHGNANLPLIFAGGKALGIKHGQHLDYNLPKIKKYELGHAGGHYGLCHTPADSNARLSNLFLTMLQKMEVNTEKFVDSLGPISEVLA